LAVGRAALASVFPEARNPHWYPDHLSEGLLTWSVKQVWLCGVERSNSAIDVSAHFAKKLAAVAKHESQMRHFPDCAGFFRSWAQEVADRHGFQSGVLAEEFHRVNAS
jgi:LmbE family N-acetylglucosaminyl deacetylase